MPKGGAFDTVAFAKTADAVLCSRQEEMKRQKTNMNNFKASKDSDSKIINYATLYSAGCFCEASDHIDYLHPRIDKTAMFPDLRDIRGGLVHANPSYLNKVDNMVTIINTHTDALKGKANLSEGTEEKESTQNDAEETTSSSSNSKRKGSFAERVRPKKKKEKEKDRN